jgi:excisionase family DNA binding protein
MRDKFRVYTPEQVAELLQLKESTVKNYIRQGKLKAAVFGTRMRVSEEHLREFFNDHVLNRIDDDEQEEKEQQKEKQEES